MRLLPRRPHRLAGALVAAAILAPLPGLHGATPSYAAPLKQQPQTIAVTLTNDGCTADPASVAAGPVTFSVKNVGGDAVTEVELLRNDLIVGEKENLAPGLSGTFSVKLQAGDYELYCPDAATERTAFVVKEGDGAASTAPADPALLSALGQAESGYRTYVQQEVGLLVTQTQALVAAVDAGDAAKAKAAYPEARLHYERIEPVAESFGDLDPAIDMREDDAGDDTPFTGFHRIEKALWQENTLADMGPVAHDLLANVQELQTLVNDPSSFEIQPATIANGAVELLDEVSQSKITGEEERYSRLDLLDMAANVEGSQKAFELLQPSLTMLDAPLADTIAARFTALNAALAQYRQGGTWAAYDTLSQEQVRALSQAVGDLAEPLSQVAAIIVGASGES
jgi:iron uptake system component EfeO